MVDPKYGIGDTVRLKVPESMYDDDKAVLGKILDRRWVEEKREWKNRWEYLVSHPFDTSGEWRSEWLILPEEIDAT